MINQVGVLETRTGDLASGRGTPAMFAGKLSPEKFMVISTNASRIPLEIASLLPLVFYLEA